MTEGEAHTAAVALGDDSWGGADDIDRGRSGRAGGRQSAGARGGRCGWGGRRRGGGLARPASKRSEEGGRERKVLEPKRETIDGACPD